MPVWRGDKEHVPAPPEIHSRHRGGRQIDLRNTCRTSHVGGTSINQVQEKETS